MKTKIWIYIKLVSDWNNDPQFSVDVYSEFDKGCAAVLDNEIVVKKIETEIDIEESKLKSIYEYKIDEIDKKIERLNNEKQKSIDRLGEL